MSDGSNGKQQPKNPKGNGAGKDNSKAPKENNPKQPEKTQKHPNDALAVQGTSVAAVQSHYRFSTEGIQALERHFSHLFVKTGDRSRFRIGGEFGYENHSHAVGAFMRAYMHDRIIYGLEPTGKILDVGSSAVRTLSRYQSAKPVVDRTWMMCPNMDVRDDFRFDDNIRRITRMINELNEREKVWGKDAKTYAVNDFMCGHQGGTTLNKYKLEEGKTVGCKCTGNFDIVTSIDSAYYPGVLEEVYSKVIKGAIGYVVVNDYKHAVLKKLKNGDYDKQLGEMLPGGKESTADQLAKPFSGYALKNYLEVPESRFDMQLRYEQGQLVGTRVKSFVEGNMMPYTHGVLNFGESKSFGMLFDDIVGHDTALNKTKTERYLMHFEQVDCFWNGDIPYKTYKVRRSKLSRWTAEQLEDVPIYDKYWNGDELEAEIMSRISKCWQSKLETEKSSVSKDGISTAGSTPKVTTPALSKSNSTISTVVEKVDYFDVESYQKKLSKNGDEHLDLVKRCKEEVGFFKFAKDQMKKTPHLFAIEYVNNEAWMTVKTLSSDFKLDKPLTWFGFKVEDEGRSARAKLSNIFEAYKLIGIKQNTNSILHSLVQYQRDGMSMDEAFTMSEAFTIARLIRMGETKRFESIALA